MLVFAEGAEDMTWAAIGLMAGSGALHALYFALLQRGYATGDLSLVYPLARGTGPLLSTMVAIVVLGERPSLLAVVGAAIVVTAVFSLVARPGGVGGGTLFAVLTGVAIAGYTLWDKQAVDGEGLNPLVYYWGTNMFNLLLLSAVGRASRGRRAGRPGTARAGGPSASACLSPLAYVLILYALARAPVSYVAPARETSILIGTLLGTTVLAEGDRDAADAGRGRDPGGRHRAGAGVNVKVNCGWVGRGLVDVDHAYGGQRRAQYDVHRRIRAGSDELGAVPHEPGSTAIGFSVGWPK